MKSQYIKHIQSKLIKYENTKDALALQKYMRDKFKFIGLRAPQRKELVKSLIREHGPPSENQFNDLIYELWELPERDYQSVALELLDDKAKKFKEEDIQLLEYLIINKSWWDK
jgi:3-methyladenine DNA glycosylase AlkD